MPRTTRSVLIQFRLRSDDAAVLEAAARAAGLSVGIYARRAVLDHATLEAIAQRLAAMPTRDEIRADLTTAGRAIAAAVKPAAATAPAARGQQS
ncbi:MAG: plasmid mobilization protein [Solirubrobacteraceae bacterium]